MAHGREDGGEEGGHKLSRYLVEPGKKKKNVYSFLSN